LKKILSIDDDPQILKAFESAIQQKGYDILTSTDPNEVGKILSEHNIDLVMLDVHMPQKSGFEIYREIRQRAPVPVLFVTGDPRAFTDPSRPGARILQEEVEKGNAGVLFKPFDVPTLYRKTDELLHLTAVAATGAAPSA